MEVSKLIDLVSELSFGRSNPTAKERKSYLRFLNLANLEMWQIAVNANSFLQIVDIFFEANTNNAPIPEGYYIKALYADNRQLKACNLQEIFDIPQGKYTNINNVITININSIQSIKIDPKDNEHKKYINALLLPNAKDLVENVTNSDTEVSIPVYPLPYHLGLVHGALFYLYTSNKGFTEKIKYQMLAWDESKKNLANYYS